jgi:hypothetical protein
VPRRQLRHLAGTDKEDRLALEGPEDLLRQLHRREAHRNGVGGDARLGSDPLGRPEGVVQELVQDGPRGLPLHRQAVGVLDLPQNLRLPHDQGIEARGHPEEVPHRLPVVMRVKTAVHLLPVQVPVTKHESVEPIRGLPAPGAGQDLHPVTGGQEQGLLDAGHPQDLRQGIAPVLAGDAQALPDLQGGRLVVHADENQAHGVTESGGPS